MGCSVADHDRTQEAESKSELREIDSAGVLQAGEAPDECRALCCVPRLVVIEYWSWAMYVLVVYDVEVKRVGRVHKFLKRHLNWVQNSVFEGELTDAQIEEVRIGLSRVMDKDIDSVLIYTAREERWLYKQVIGRERGNTDNLL